MFTDLKEYQDITKIYNESVNISDEQRAINKLFAEENFTLEEIDYLEENFDTIWEEELEPIIIEELYESVEQIETLTEENINEVFGLKLLSKGAMKANRGILKNIVKGKKFSKTATTAVKDTFKGAKSGIGSMLNKAKPFAKKAAKALGTGLLMGTGAALPLGLTGLAVGNTLRKRGKAEREAEEAKKAAEAKAKADAEKAKETKGGAGAAGGAALGALAGVLKNTSTSFGDAIKANTPKPQSTVIQNTMKDGGKKVEKKAPPKPPTTTKTKMGSIEKENRKRFGDSRVDFLKQKQKDFKLMKSKGMSKDDFAKKYPNSNTAKDMKKRKKAPQVMDYESYMPDAYDTVLEYLANTQQASTLEEANYIMMEMDQQTIGDIVKESRPLIESAINELAQRNPYELIIEYLLEEEVASSVDEAVAIIEELDDETLQQVLDENIFNKAKTFVGNKLNQANNLRKQVVSKGKEILSSKDKLNTLNPLSKDNKRIRDKKASMTDDNKGKVTSQISAIKRQRDGKTIADVQAANKQSMQDRARAKNEAFKKRQQEFKNRKNK